MPNTNNVDHINITDLGTKIGYSDGNGNIANPINQVKSKTDFNNANNPGELPSDTASNDISNNLIQIGSNIAITLGGLAKVFDNYIARHNDLPYSQNIISNNQGLNSAFSQLFGNLSRGSATPPSIGTPNSFQDILYYILQLIHGVGNTIYTNLYDYVGYTGSTGTSLTDLINTLFTRTGVRDSQYLPFPPSGASVSLMDRINYLYSQTFSKGSNNIRTSWESKNLSLALRISQLEQTIGVNDEDTTVLGRVTSLENNLISLLNNSFRPRITNIIPLMDEGLISGEINLTIKGGNDYIMPNYFRTSSGSFDEENTSGLIKQIIIDFNDFYEVDKSLTVSDLKSSSTLVPRNILEGNKATIIGKASNYIKINVNNPSLIEGTDDTSTLSTDSDISTLADIPHLPVGPTIDTGGIIVPLPEGSDQFTEIEIGTGIMRPIEGGTTIEPLKSVVGYVNISQLGISLVLQNIPNTDTLKILINNQLTYASQNNTATGKVLDIFENLTIDNNTGSYGPYLWFYMEVTYEPSISATSNGVTYCTADLLRINIKPYIQFDSVDFSE